MQMLSNTVLDVNVYYIITGMPGQGSIITRSPTGVDNIDQIT